MVERSQLDESDTKFMPLYRPRSFDKLRRKLNKCVEGMTWFKNLELYDNYRNEWEKRSNVRRQRTARSNIQNGAGDTICAMFVPQSKNGLLMKKIEEAEFNLKGDLSICRGK